MKGIYKGFKYGLTQFFVKEPEMEIGGPTDVKHVAHIGLDGSSGSAPSWMSEYKSANDATTSLGNSASGSTSGTSPWSSREFDDSMRQQSQSDGASTEVAAGVKKEKRRKKPRSNNNNTNSPKSSINGSCSSRPSRPAKPKTKFIEDNAKPANIEVV